MIYTVTFNPAIDYCLSVNNLKLGETNRSQSEEIYFGGKGINVSTVLTNLGADNVALGFTAGFTGDRLLQGLKEKGIKTDFIKLSDGMTRINVKIEGEQETEINTNGPSVTEEHIEMLLEKLQNLSRNDILVLAGSIPPSVDDYIYKTLMNKVSRNGVKVVVDATDELLLNTLPLKPFLIKPNLAELEQLVGEKLSDASEIISAAKKLKIMGAENVLVSMGAEGAILVDEFGKVFVEKAPEIQVVNTVGAGDSMVAGFLSALDKGYEYALKYAVAVGSASASKKGLATKNDVAERL